MPLSVQRYRQLFHSTRCEGTAMFNVTISTENDATLPRDVATLLRQIAAHLGNGLRSGPVVDDNGNTVGHWFYKSDFNLK
jgi:hypothetical protein